MRAICRETLAHQCHAGVRIFSGQPENPMAKGEQRSNKEAKKPKKDSSPSKPISSDAIVPTRITVVPERSKKK
jgi:hypothetical protein